MKKVTILFFAVLLVVGLVLPMASVAAYDATKLVGHWQFDTDASDRTPYANDGTLTDGALIAGAALTLDGVNDYVEVANHSSLDITSAITVEGWIKLTSFSQPATVAGKWRDISGTNLRGYLLTVATDGTPKFYVSTTGSDYPSAAGSALSLDTWYHLAGTYDGTNIKLYVDGTLVNTVAQAGAIFSNSEPLLIGANDGWGGSTRKFTNGVVDDVRIWSEALTVDRLMDTSPPVVTITYPVDGTCYQSISGVSGSATDANIDPSTAFQWNPSTIPTGEGTHTLSLTATDILGYSATSTSVTYTIDSTAPVVNITAPVDGAYYAAGAVPTGAFTVTEINSYTTVESGWSDAPGTHTYTVTATDCAGNVGADSVTYYVLEHFVTGGGNITEGKGKNAAKVTFGGNVGYDIEGNMVGDWNIVLHNVNNDALDKGHIKITTITEIVFANDASHPELIPDPPDADYHYAHFVADVLVNGEDLGWSVKVSVTDYGEGNKINPDEIRIRIYDGGTLIYDTSLEGGGGDFPNSAIANRTPLDGGNIQIHPPEIPAP